MTAASLGARAALSLVAAAGLTAVGLARLRRVQRPREEPTAAYARGEVWTARVTLGAHTLGSVVRCGGREVFTALGERPLAVFEGDADGRRFVVAGDGRRALLLGARGCAASVREGVGALRSVSVEGARVTVAHAGGRIVWIP